MNKGSQYGLAVINHAFHLCDPGFKLRLRGGIWARTQSDSEGFSPGTPVFLPHQNRLSVNYIRLRGHTFDGDNLWYPSLSLNWMNKVELKVCQTGLQFTVLIHEELKVYAFVGVITKTALLLSHLKTQSVGSVLVDITTSRTVVRFSSNCTKRSAAKRYLLHVYQTGLFYWKIYHS